MPVASEISGSGVVSKRRINGHGPLALNPQKVCQPNDGLLIHVCRDVGHQCQVFHQTTGFSFRCIAGTEHPPLTRLQRARSADLPRLLELGADTRHHPQGRDKRKTGQYMGNACPVHFESFKRPVSGGDGPHEAGCNEVPSELHGIESVEFGCAGGFFQDLIDPRLQCHVESLE